MITFPEFVYGEACCKSKPELAALLNAVVLSGKVINSEIRRAGLADLLGDTGDQNVQGELQTKMDLFANDCLKNALLNRRVAAGYASEEEEHIVLFNDGLAESARYVVLADPLDGSSNIDVNVTVGTIFSVYERITPIDSPVTIDDFTQHGRAQVAAGYIIYGSSAMLVYTTGKGVHAFTYDQSLGEFFLCRDKLQLPSTGTTYSINEGNMRNYSQGIRNYVANCQQENISTGKPFSSRYIGSLVADFHRNLIHGGIYLYPESRIYNQGKLRLMYECNPMGFIAEQASARATNGLLSVLDIDPDELHQRSPFYVGSSELIKKLHINLVSML
ncbi:class 1 fructose-bisphosphatase [Candidatus Pantoea deserta]|uniref:Fructose-1,6-bisphosphatase class 1 n=1 Tax=Candidatus Pantoea deserta TaxID=1869313 RepID=A0A3N4PJD5_9GAMM|nr:class 1 fructose-bisphosphatase [Pantoea deserta]RPD99713.1 class 1 fructose-bisphosphatase [Pantoea deserta]